ncbi:DUF4234 domain-containing protein [Acinetobacter sp. MD2(2019)]|uniref:DUF4234 domain-containing protein n=1 Tax=Acinetobacter sp. MD2(2019) TaxID=2605273 RepID=UPI002D1E95F7|nr:DUF4234 domain-containing protein [Acinetobacter sp. MD2(2019)]MEB3754744.1 DUF4234 domain-containing protein [Acinetobacter sp. MD2(2019)]
MSTITSQPIFSTIDPQRIISLKKFIFLSILTFGIYDIWWIFTAWRFFQQKDQLKIMPALRSIFCIFFLYQLFNKIKKFSNETGHTQDYSSGLLFVGYIFTSMLYKLPDPFWLISFASIVFLIQPFQALNAAKIKSAAVMVIEGKSLSKPEIILIILFSIFWILVVLGLFITPN